MNDGGKLKVLSRILAKSVAKEEVDPKYENDVYQKVHRLYAELQKSFHKTTSYEEILLTDTIRPLSKKEMLYSVKKSPCYGFSKDRE